MKLLKQVLALVVVSAVSLAVMAQSPDKGAAKDPKSESTSKMNQPSAKEPAKKQEKQPVKKDPLNKGSVEEKT